MADTYLEQLLHAALDGELRGAGDLARGGGGHTRVQPGVLGVDVLEHQRQGVLLVLEQNLKGEEGHEGAGTENREEKESRIPNLTVYLLT